MSITRWDPFFNLVTLPEAINQVFTNSFVMPQAMRGIDMHENANDVIVRAVLPGIKPEDIKITVTGKVLTISSLFDSSFKGEQEPDKQKYQFYRQVLLPVEVESDKADAWYEYGILTLTLPKVEIAKPHQIPLRIGNATENLRLEASAPEPTKEPELAGTAH